MQHTNGYVQNTILLHVVDITIDNNDDFLFIPVHSKRLASCSIQTPRFLNPET
jgi:hypothetical protein